MADTIDMPAGGYRYIPGVFQYSAGVRALDGYRIERAEFVRPVPLAAGFAFIERYLHAQGIPLAGFCACELRSPAAFTDAGFIAFNRQYVGTLERWGIMRDDKNPVARSNVCPEQHKPAEPSFHAFCFTRAAPMPPARSSSPAAARRRRVTPPTANAPSASATPARPGCARRRCSCWTAWRSAWRQWARRGRIPPRHRSIPLRPVSLSRRRDRPARRSAARADLAFRASPGGRAGLRNGLPQRADRAPRQPLGDDGN